MRPSNETLIRVALLAFVIGPLIGWIIPGGFTARSALAFWVPALIPLFYGWMLGYRDGYKARQVEVKKIVDDTLGGPR